MNLRTVEDTGAWHATGHKVARVRYQDLATEQLQHVHAHLGFPDGSVVRAHLQMQETVGLIPGSVRSPGEESTTHSVFLHGKYHGGRGA